MGGSTVQSNLFNTDTKGKEPSVRFTGVHIIEVGNVRFLACLGPNKLFAIERCPCYRGVHKERLDCTYNNNEVTLFNGFRGLFPSCLKNQASV